jgi:hypothetical protein
VKTIGLMCDVSSAATGNFQWGMGLGSTFTATGLVSGQTIVPSGSAVGGNLMTIGTGTLTVTKDASSPSYSIVAAGTSGVTLGVLKFHAANESVSLEQVALQLTNTSSSSATNLSSVSLWDGTTQVGSAIFSGSGTTTLVTLTTPVSVPKDGDKTLTIKGNLASIDVNTVSTHEGAFVAVDYDGDSQAGTTKGTGSSGAALTSASVDTAMSGVRMFKSFPTVKDATTQTSLTAGANMYEFDVTADASGAIQLNRISFSVATSSGGNLFITNFKLFGPNGAVNATAVNSSAGKLVINFDASADDRIVAAGATKRFRLQAENITHGTGTDNLTLKLLGDAAYPAMTTLVGTVATVDADNAADDFIWSPQATTTVVAADIDWTNGLGVPTGSGTQTLTTDGTSHSFTKTN